MKNLFLLLILGSVLTSSVFVFNDAYAAGFIKFDGIDGESKDKDHKGWSDLVSFIQDSSSQDTMSARANPVVLEISVVKELDKSSPKIAESIAMGKVFPKVEVQLTKNDGTFHSYELTNVMITSYSLSGDSNEKPTEKITLFYEKLVESFEQTKTIKEPIEEIITEPEIKEIPASEIVRVPSWVQITASFWVEGDVSDREFTDGIGFLVKEKIIDLDEKVESSGQELSESEVPSWIKESTKWWIDGQVPEDQFLESIKWLIKNNIIRGVQK